MENNADLVFEELFQEHWERIFGVIFRLVGDQAEAEDLALEVFWRLYQQAPDIKEPVKLGGWLYRVATNLGYNSLRAEKRRSFYERLAAKEGALNQNVDSPEAQAEREAERRRVRDTLAAMKPRAAKMLVLRHSGLSYQEIASAVRVAPGSVGTLLARAELAFSRHYLKAEGR